MTKYYKKYRAADFLADDCFIKYVVAPTPESHAFWSGLMERGEIDEAEFVSAFTLVQSFSMQRPDVPEQRLEAVWGRITATNLKGRQPLRRRWPIVSGIAAAACAAGAAIIVAVSSNGSETADGNISDLAREYVIKNDQPSDRIQVLTGEVALDLEGEEATVEYDNSGGIMINAEPVEVKPKTDAEVQICQIRVPFGKRATLKLADGSALWLNSGSTVFYPSTFVKDTREIFVDGEIYAEIARDSLRPFIARTNAMDVTVLGTSFNLSAYKGEPGTSLVLVNGAVKVKPRNRESVSLLPNQMFSCTEESCSVENVEVENYISWRDGVYIFNNEPIENILHRIARYYNVSMKLPVTSPGITCSGKLLLQDDLQQLLHGLSQITPMRYIIADNNECLIRFDNP